MLSFPRPGISHRPRHSDRRDDTQGARRRAQRAGDRRGRAHLPGEGPFTRAEHFRAMEPRLEAFSESAAAGTRRGGCAAPSRCASSETQAMKVVLLGATKGMGRALARRMAERGDRLFLLGRDPRRAGAQRPRPGGARRRRRRSARRAAICSSRTASRRPSTAPAPRSDGSTRSWSPPACSPRRSSSKPTPTLRRPAAGGRLRQHRRCSAKQARARLLAGRRRHAVRVQLGGRRARPQARHPLRRGQGGPVALPRGPRPQVPGRGPATSSSSPASSRRA